MKTERRYVASEVEVRNVTDTTATIEGYAAVFEKDSQPLGFMGFIERVKRGAFKKTIKEADVRALRNHDPNFVLGRNKAGTLRLAEDSTGLHYEDDLDLRNSDHMNMFLMIERGDVSQSSFGFSVISDSWEYDDEEFPVRRTLEEVKLFDVSPVTYPAYLDTEVDVQRALRSLSAASDIPLEVLEEAATKNDLRTALTKHEDTPEPVTNHSKGAVFAAKKMRLKELEPTPL